MSTPLELSVERDLRPELLDDLTREIELDLNRAVGVEASPVTRPVATGERAIEVAAVGKLLVKLLSGDAAKLLVDSLRQFFERDRSLTIVLRRGDSEIRIEGKDVNAQRLDGIVQAVERLATVQAKA